MISSCVHQYGKSIDGIAVEKVDNIRGNEYTIDNKIYKGGKEFTYRYEYKKEGEILYFNPSKDLSKMRKGWEIVNENHIDSNTITHVKMLVLKDQGRFAKKEDYRESVIEYQYLTRSGKPYFKELTKFAEQTGLIENRRNIWLHPPRGYLFAITELNPWPYVKFPVKKGKSWNWKLEIGDKWKDVRWKEWEGNIINEYEYRIEGKEQVESKFGKIECTKIVGEGESRIGSTKLTSYFNENLGGFIKVRYENIDGSELMMELIEVN